MKNDYVHGYHHSENTRLQDQADTLSDLFHSDTFYPAGSLVLEAGCGVGAQTITLAKNSPEAQIIAIDISAQSIAKARVKVEAAGHKNVRFERGDIFNLNFPEGSFDHIFLCLVLEHLPDPIGALCELKKYLKVNGTITSIEGDHGSAYFHPDSEEANQAIQCQVELQRRMGGNANIGRSLYPILVGAGFRDNKVSPRLVYIDASKPELVEGFTKNTFTSMIAGVRNQAISEGLITGEIFDKGINGLRKTAEKEGVFCYTFFKGIGVK